MKNSLREENVMVPRRPVRLAALVLIALGLVASPALAQNSRIPSSVSVTNLESYLLLGWTDNQGALFTGPVRDASAQGMVQLQWNFGYGFGDPDYSINPYTGLGGRLWGDKLEGPNGYTRTTSWYYLPVGIYLSGLPEEGYRVGPVVKVEYRELIDGNVEHNLEDVGLRTVDTSQDDGFGLNLTIEGYVDPRTRIQGYLEYWDVAPSESKSVGGLTAREPSNETTMIGANFGYAF